MGKKRVIRASIVMLGLVVLLTGVALGNNSYVKIEDDPIALSGTEETGTVLVEQTADDLNVIPDKYNTGAKGKLEKVALGAKIGEIQLVGGSNATKNVFDFYYRNKNIVGTVTIENYDFSAYPITQYSLDKTKRKICLVFNNCKFSKIILDKNCGNISYKFNDCSIESFYGSNASFDRCKIGETYNDGMNPFQQVEVKNCFFTDFGSMKNLEGDVHSDGVQIFGATGIDMKDISFSNCRFEIPPVVPEGSKASINACITISPGKSSGKSIYVTDCILNGGGYSIYACANDNIALDDLKICNVRFCAKKYEAIYHRGTMGISIGSIEETENLYVASVWKTNGKTHFSVSNDTNRDRVLKIITDLGEYKYIIPACKKGNDMTCNDKYSEMPFDIDITIDKNVKYAVCYDETFEGVATQIRFMNWSGKKVFISEDEKNSLLSNANEILDSGQCGKKITYELNKAGILTLQGTGQTYSYNSKNKAPWMDYSGEIKKVIVKEGIDGLGHQLFLNCSSIKEVELPEGLRTIGSRTFYNCIGISTITLPSTLKELGDSSLPYFTITNIYYAGDDWNKINTKETNELLYKKLHLSEQINSTANSTKEIQGECGKDVCYSLSNDGVLKITGNGETYNYHSQKPAPWFDYRKQIVKVEISDGITKVGEQLFRECENLSQVQLPESLIVIGKNSFIFCHSLQEIEIPVNVENIQERAFDGTALDKVKYLGNKEQWDKIIIGDYNTKLVQNVNCEK